MTQKAEMADERLVGRMLDGDAEAFAVLYRRRRPAIYRFALHMSGNSAVADDVTQEVFMALIREPARFDPRRGSLAAFLFGIARNHLRKHWDHERRLVPIVRGSEETDELVSAGVPGNGHLPTTGTSYSRKLETDETIQRVRRAILTLPGTYREVVVLCELQEMNYEEAADALGCPVGTVRSRLHRARNILMGKLRDAQTVRRAPAVGERAER